MLGFESTVTAEAVEVTCRLSRQRADRCVQQRYLAGCLAAHDAAASRQSSGTCAGSRASQSTTRPRQSTEISQHSSNISRILSRPRWTRDFIPESGRAEHLGCLLLGEPFELGQRDGFAIGRRKPRDEQRDALAELELQIRGLVRGGAGGIDDVAASRDRIARV